VYLTWVGSCLTRKQYTILERLARSKHSSFLRKFVSYDRKKFYNSVPRLLSEHISWCNVISPTCRFVNETKGQLYLNLANLSVNLEGAYSRALLTPPNYPPKLESLSYFVFDNLVGGNALAYLITGHHEQNLTCVVYKQATAVD
jgi:hypothetical protein